VILNLGLCTLHLGLCSLSLEPGTFSLGACVPSLGSVCTLLERCPSFVLHSSFAPARQLDCRPSVLAMVGNAGSGLWGRRDIASMNARRPHRTHADRGRPSANRGQYGAGQVHAEAAAGAGFSFERSDKNQCIKGQRYAMSDDHSEEAEYFVPLIAEALVKASKEPAPAPIHPFLAFVATEVENAMMGPDDEELLEFITIHEVEYGQLLPCSRPDLSLRDGEQSNPSYVPATDWENYKAPDRSGKERDMVQAPVTEGGGHFSVSNIRAWPWTFVLTCTVDTAYKKDQDGEDLDELTLQDLKYGISITMTRRSTAHRYIRTQSEKDTVISIKVGEINQSTNRLVAWKTPVTRGPSADCIKLQDVTLMHSLFYQVPAPTGYPHRAPPGHPQGTPLGHPQGTPLGHPQGTPQGTHRVPPQAPPGHPRAPTGYPLRAPPGHPRAPPMTPLPLHSR